MQKLAVLLTCFNRKDKTVAALTALDNAFKNSPENWQMSIYLTDDGSSDGTSDAVAANFPDANILQGDGSLYWAGGMRNSWGQAIKGNYDAYLLLNDDTNVSSNLFDSVAKTHKFCKSNFEKGGIYIGTTVDAETKKVTYGGSVFKNRFLAKMSRIQPKDHPVPCQLGNANIMWVSKNVVDAVGILSEGYVHGMADYDYTLKAGKKKLPALVMPGIVGECTNDHSDKYVKFFELPMKERRKMLYHPLGFDFVSQTHHMRKHFPLRYPFFVMVGYIKVLFPKIYYHLLYKRRKSL
ncbi:glycosyltransferase family 2 protein [Flagellimonas sp. 2504JD4-2]